MRGHDDVIEVLNEVLTAELTAVNQYFLHAKMMQNWGFHRLADHSRHESIDEMKHAEEVTDRILYFEGVPNYQRYFPLRIGENVPEMFQADLDLEYAAVERLNRGIALTRRLEAGFGDRSGDRGIDRSLHRCGGGGLDLEAFGLGALGTRPCPRVGLSGGEHERAGDRCEQEHGADDHHDDQHETHHDVGVPRCSRTPPFRLWPSLRGRPLG